MSPHGTEPDSDGPTAPAPRDSVLFCHHDDGESCPGPTRTLIDDHFQPTSRHYTPDGRLSPIALHRHVAACDPCLRRLLGCARIRRCDHSWVALEGAVTILAKRTAHQMFAEAFMWAEARDQAETRGLRMLWASPRLDPTELTSITNLPGYVMAGMRKALASWLRDEERQQGGWRGGPRAERNVPFDPADPDNDQSRTRLQIRDLSSDPEAMALAHDQVAILNGLLAVFAGTLENQPRGADRVTLFRLWLDAKLTDRAFTQTKASRTLQASGIPISQPTVYRWITTIQLDLLTVLDDPTNRLDPTWRDAAIRFFCRPTRPLADQDDPARAAGSDDPPAAPHSDTDHEAGSEHD